MHMHLQPAVAALAGAILLAAGAGCTPTLHSAQPPARTASERPELAVDESTESIRGLTQRVNWAPMEMAPVIQGF